MKRITSNSDESVPLINSRNLLNWIPLFKRLFDEKILGKFDAKHLEKLNDYLMDTSGDEMLNGVHGDNSPSIKTPRTRNKSHLPTHERTKSYGLFKKVMLSCSVAVPISDFSGVYHDDLPNVKNHKNTLFEVVFP
eukprot:g6386.t1